MQVTQALSPEAIAALKARQGRDVFELKVSLNDDNTEFAYAYLSAPTRKVLGMVMSRYQANPITAAELLLENCLIRELSDERILTDDSLFIAAAQRVDGLIAVRHAELKKT